MIRAFYLKWILEGQPQLIKTVKLGLLVSLTMQFKNFATSYLLASFWSVLYIDPPLLNLGFTDDNVMILHINAVINWAFLWFKTPPPCFWKGQTSLMKNNWGGPFVLCHFKAIRSRKLCFHPWLYQWHNYRCLGGDNLECILRILSLIPK